MRNRSGRYWFGKGRGLGWGLVVWLWAPLVVASSEYPKDVQELVEVPCAPTCTLCHRDMNGGFGTVSKPFGLALMNAGLTANDQQSLIDALLVVGNSGVDSDGDGETDIQELKAGKDPNLDGGGELCPVEYGCGGARVASRPSRGPLAPFAVLGAAMLLWWRRRPRQKPSHHHEMATNVDGEPSSRPRTRAENALASPRRGERVFARSR